MMDDVVFSCHGAVGSIKHDVMFREEFARWQYHQLDFRQLVFGCVRQNAAPGTKSAIYD